MSDAEFAAAYESPEAQIQLAQAVADQAAADAAREEELASPAAQAEREDSESAYDDLDGGEAREALEDEHQDALDALEQDPGRAITDEDVERTSGDSTVLVDPGEPGGPLELVESNTPLVAENENGQVRPVDLDRKATTNGFEPRNPLVPLELPSQAGGGFELAGRLGFALEGADSARAGLPLGDKDLIYPNVMPDTDLIASPISVGVEVFTQLRSPESPEELRFDYALPTGAQLVQEGDGALIVLGEEVIAAIPEPWALDAQGTPIEIVTTVEENDLVLEVPHRGADVAYPILVDPVNDAYDWYGGQSGTAQTDVQLEEWFEKYSRPGVQDKFFLATSCKTNFAPNCPSGSGSGLYLYAKKGNFQGGQQGGSTPRDSASWHYEPPGADTFISSASFSRQWFRLGSDSSPWPFLFSALLTPDGYSAIKSWQNGPNLTDHANSLTHGQGQPAYGRPGADSVVFGLDSSSQNYSLNDVRWAYLGAVSIGLGDTSSPAVGSAQVSAANSSAVGRNGWTGPTDLKATASASDTGLGVKRVTMERPLASGGTEVLTRPEPSSCIGGHQKPCPASFSADFTFPAAATAQGRQDIKFTAYDALDKPSDVVTRQVMIDTKAPTVDPLSQTTPPEASPTLQIKAADGTRGADPKLWASGVKEIRVQVNNEQPRVFANPDANNPQVCSSPADSCPQTLNFTLNREDYARDDFLIKVTAVDFLGQVSAERQVQWTFPPDGTPPSVSGVNVLQSGSENGTGKWISSGSYGVKQVSATDNKGVKKFRLKVPGHPVQERVHGCTGDAPTTCPKTWSLPSTTPARTEFDHYATQPMPEGESKVELEAEDVKGNIGKKEFKVRVDRGGPALTYQGGLTTRAPATAPNNSLSITATDGTYGQDSSLWRSGVKEIRVQLDNGPAQVFTNQDACARVEGSCPQTANYTLTQSRYLESTIKVTAVDHAGNQTTESWSVRPSPEQLPPSLSARNALVTGTEHGAGNWTSSATYRISDVTATDYSNGTGIKRFRTSVPKADGSAISDERVHDCAATEASPCPITWSLPSTSPARPIFDTYPTSAMREGETKVTYQALDAAGNLADKKFDVRVDRSGPELDLSGGLSEAEGDEVTDQTLDINAMDGDPNGPPGSYESGVRQITVQVDDGPIETVYEEDCAPATAPEKGSCGVEEEFNLSPLEVERSRFQLKVTATDQVGNTTSDTWTKTFPDGSAEVTRLVCRTYDSDPDGSPDDDGVEETGRGDSDCSPPQFEWIDDAAVETTVFGEDKNFDDLARPPPAGHASNGDSRGVRRVILTLPDSDGAFEVRTDSLDCEPGEDPKICPRAGGATFKYETADLPEGSSRAVARVQHAAGLYSADKAFDVQVDRSAPTVDLSGELIAPGLAGVPIDPDNELPIVLTPATRFKLGVAGTDGDNASAATKRSGVRSIEVRIDDPLDDEPSVRQAFDTQHCPQSSCALDLSTILRADDVGIGVFNVDVSVVDHVGHETSKSFQVESVSAPEVLPDSELSKQGLEQYFQYSSTETGVSGAHVNTATGNLVWHKTPAMNAGRGLSSVWNLTYNSLGNGDPSAVSGLSLGMLGPYNRFGSGVSSSISGVTRLNEPLSGVLLPAAPTAEDPFGADDLADVSFTDPDGTKHTFPLSLDEPVESCGRESSSPLPLALPTTYDAPAGVNLRLRRFDCIVDDLLDSGPLESLSDEEINDLQQATKRAWAITRPDGVTYFYDLLGFATSIEDRNGNVLEYEYEKAHPLLGRIPLVDTEWDDVDLPPDVNPCELADSQIFDLIPSVPGVCEPRVTGVIDPGGREMVVDYYDLSDFVSVGPDQIEDALEHLATASPLDSDYLRDLGDKLGLCEPTDAPGSLEESECLSQLMSLGKVEKVTDHEGRITQLTYDERGQLETIKEAASDPDDERVTKLSYDEGSALEASQLVGITDPLGEETAIAYEELEPSDPGNALPGRRVKSVTDRGGARRDVDYAESEAEQTVLEQESSTTVSDPYRGQEPDPAQGSTFTVDGEDRPIEIEDQIGRLTTLKWDADNNVEELVEASGTDDAATTLFSYNANGMLTSTADSPGANVDGATLYGLRMTFLGYRDTAGVSDLRSEFGTDEGDGFVSDLTAITKPKGNSWTFELDQTDASLLSASDSDDCVADETDPISIPPVVEPRGNVTSEVAPDGGASDNCYDEHGQLGSTRDQVGNLTTVTAYDDNGLPTALVDPKGNAGEESNHRWAYRYDEVGNLIQTVDPRAAQAMEEGVPSGHPAGSDYTTTLTYDAFDRLLSEQIPKDTTASAERFIERSYTYDDNGNLRTAKNGVGDVDTSLYNAMDRLESSTNGAGNTTLMCYDAEQQLERVITPRGAESGRACEGGARGFATSYEFDPAGRVLAEIREAQPGGQDLITSYALDARDNIVGVAYPKNNTQGSQTVAVSDAITRATEAEHQRWSMSYDRTDQLVSRIELPGNEAEAMRTDYRYDANGNQTRVIDPRAFASGVDDAEFTSVTEYDSVDRVLSETDALGGTTRYEYRPDGKVVAVTGPRADETGFADDFKTRFEYDANGGLTSRSLPFIDGQYGLDASDPEDLSELEAMRMTISRDVVGNPETVTDYVGNLAKQRALMPKYDDVEGDQEDLYADHTFENEFFDTGDLRRTPRPGYWRFEGPGQPLTLAPRSANAGMENEELPSAEGVGDLGPVEPAAMPGLMPMAGDTRFAYDGDMRLQSIAVTGGGVSSLGYDGAGRVKTITRPFKPGDPIVETTDYDANGNVKTVTDGTLAQTTTVYDEFDRPEKEIRPGSPADETTKYEYDPNGNVRHELTPRSVAGANFEWTYQYDDADRLIKEVNPESEAWQYEYDLVGNQIEKLNPSEDNLTETEFDALSRPVAITEASGSGVARVTRFGYDAAGNRVLVDAPGAAVSEGAEAVRNLTRFEYDGRDLLWKETTQGQARETWDGPVVGDLRTTITEYDPNGNLRRTINPQGASETYLPDPGVHFTQANKAAVADATQKAMVNEYNPDDLRIAAYLPWSDDDPAADQKRYKQGFVRDYSKEPQGWITSVEAPYEWESTGPSDEIDVTRYSYFDNGWISSTSQPKRDLPTRSSGANAPKAPDPELNEVQDIEYDYNERGEQTLWLSDPIDSPARKIVRDYWPSGMVKSRIGSIDGGETRKHTYDYNANRSLSRFEDTYPTDSGAVTEITRLCRDGAERVSTVDDDANGAIGGMESDTRFVYDDDGSVTKRYTDGEWSASGPECGPGDDERYTGGKTTVFAYDALDQEAKSGTYDEPIPANSDPWDETAQDYEAPEHQFETEHHPSGEVSERTKPNGTVESYYFDQDGRQNSIVRDPEEGETETQPYRYDRNGNRLIDEKGTYIYNARDHLTQWTRDEDYEAGGETVSYTVDGSGQITEEISVGEESTTTTSYSYLGQRLDYTSSSDDGGTPVHTTYGYDAFGNMDEVLTDPPGSASDSSTTYAYDAFSRRIESEVDKPDGNPNLEDEHEFYRYDGLDRRVWRKDAADGNKIYESAYVGLSEQLSSEKQTDGAGDSKKSYDYDSRGARLAQDVEMSDDEGEPSEGNGYKPFATDSQGTVIGLEGEEGEIEEDDKYFYDPYGSLEFGDGDRSGENDSEVPEPEDGLPDALKENPFRFQGHYYDAGIQTYDMKARSYLPQIGRFTSEDRYEAAGVDLNLQSDPLTQNRYAFAGGNPISGIEWDGHCVTPDACLNGTRPRDRKRANRISNSYAQAGAERQRAAAKNAEAKERAEVQADVIDKVQEESDWYPEEDYWRLEVTDVERDDEEGLYTVEFADGQVLQWGIGYSAKHPPPMSGGITNTPQATLDAIEVADKISILFAAARTTREGIKQTLKITTSVASRLAISAELGAGAVRGGTRRPIDIARSTNYPDPPIANGGIGTIGTRPEMDQALDDILASIPEGATDIRVNQEQVGLGDGVEVGSRLGRNRPDVQWTYDDKRYYVEAEFTGPGNRMDDHQQRILANDSEGIFVPHWVARDP